MIAPTPPDTDRLRDRFRGALLGTLVGDALGMPVEGWPAQAIRQELGEVREMLDVRLGRGTYTDDTQMTLALAEALMEAEDPTRPDPDRIAHHFGRRFDPDRGYGGNTGRILAAIQGGEPWGDAVEARRLPGGSYANGAAMRVSPAALACFPDAEATVRVAELQAAPTGHDHPEARFGARLQAAGVLACLTSRPGEGPPAPEVILRMASHDWSGEVPERFIRAMDWVKGHPGASPEEAASALGNGLRAAEAVPAALWAFLAFAHESEEVVVQAVGLGGDTDTIGAMAGALAGAWNGASSFPSRWLEAVEGGPEGREGLTELADGLLSRRNR